MIYFFDVNHELVKVVTSENIISARHEQELNGIIISDVELDLNYTKSFIDEASLFGYYYKGTFYLHDIQRVEDFHGDDLVSIHGRHIFFNDMQYGKLIEDVRPTDRNAYDMLAQTIEANTRWSLDFHATTGSLSTNFYWKTPYEVLEWIVNNFRLEYEPRILFDGQQINGYMLHINNALGSNTGIRIPYGDRVLSLTHDIDYSEVITRLAPRGKGELLEGGSYGRRINIKDVEVNQDGIVSPIGDYYLEDTNIAHQYESDRHAEIIFEDVEDVNTLIEEGISAYQDMSRPKMNFEADVQDIGDVNIGDSVAIVRHEYEIYFNARVHMISVDLLNQSDAQVELGDYEHFKESKSERAQRRVRENLIRESERFDREVQQMREEFEQALIDAHAEIAAIDERMTTEIANEIAEFESAFNSEVQAAKDLAEQQIADTEQRINTTIDTTRTEMEDAFNLEVQTAKDLAEQQIADAEQRINTAIDTTRTEMEQDYNQAVINAREYAEQQAEQQASAVDSKLETMRGDHAGLIQQNTDNIANVNDFIGPRDRTLQSILDEQRTSLEEKIEIYNRAYPNLLVGTSLGNVTGFMPYLESEIELREDESLSYIRTYPIRDGANGYEFPDFVYLEQGKTYTIGIDFRSKDVRDLDYIYFFGRYNNVAISPLSQTRGLTADGTWHRYYFTFDWINTSRDAKVMIATNFNAGDTTRGWFDTRQVHLYEGDAHDIPWSPSASDNNQVVNQLLYEVRKLDDGMSSLATKTEFDILSGNVTQLTNEYTSTSAEVSSKLQSFDDLLGDNGSHFTQVADQVQSKVWLNDIHNPNLLSYTDVHLLSDRQRWNRWNVSITGSAYDGEFLWVRNVDSRDTIGIISPKLKIEAGRTYTLSWVGLGNNNMNVAMNYCYVMYDNNTNRSLALPTRTVIPTSPAQYGGRTVYKYRVTFEGHYSDTAGVMIGGYTHGSGLDVSFFVKEPKLELGDRATSYYTAFTGITQRISEIELLSQEIDGGVLRQSDITVSPSSVRIGSTEILDGNILSSVLNVSPSAIDVITQKMRLSGDLYIDGDITTLAIEAVEGNFASLIVANLETNKLRARHINANAIGADHLLVDSALINKLSASSIFTDMLTTKTISAVEGNFGELIVANLETNKLRARHINTNAIGADHLYVTNAMIEKLVANSILTDEMTARSIDAINGNFARLFASEISTVDLNASNITTGTLSSERLQVNNALINRLISNSILTSEMRAQSLTAVRGDIADLRTRILTSDVITSTHISSSNALIDKLFASSALISRLTSKSAFISSIQTIDLAADQIRVGFNGISNNVTINSSGITIDSGALTVNRTDGGAPTIIDGVNPSGIALFPATPHRRDSEFTIQGQYAVRDSGSNFLIYDFYMFEWFYSDLMFDFAIYNFENHDIRVRIEITGTDGSTFSKAVDYTVPHTPTRVRFPRMILNLGVPDGSLQRFFIRVRNIGTSSQHGRFGIHTYMVKHLDNGHGYPRLEI